MKRSKPRSLAVINRQKGGDDRIDGVSTQSEDKKTQRSVSIGSDKPLLLSCQWSSPRSFYMSYFITLCVFGQEGYAQKAMENTL